MKLCPKGLSGCLLVIFLLVLLSALYSILYCQYYRNDGPGGDPDKSQLRQEATVSAPTAFPEKSSSSFQESGFEPDDTRDKRNRD